MLWAGVYVVLRSARVQTILTHQLAHYLSNKLNTTVQIKGVDIELFNKVILRGVFIADQRHDTLLYSKKLNIGIRSFSRSKGHIVLSKMELFDTYFNLRQYKGDSTLNLDFIINAFASDDTTKSTSTFYLEARKLKLTNVRFKYRDDNDTSRIEHGIRYSDMYVYDLNTDMTNVSVVKDSIFANIRSLNLAEKSGFKIHQLSTVAKVSPNTLRCKGLILNTNNTKVNADVVFNYKEYGDYLDFNNKVKMQGVLRPTVVCMQDIAYFAPQLNGFDNTVKISGKVNGTVNYLKVKGFDLTTGANTRIKGNLSMNGLPDINSTYIDLNLDYLQTSKTDLEKFPLYPFSERKKVKLFDNFAELGTVKFKGKFNGFIEDFVTYGRIETAIGSISADMNFKYDKVNEAVYSGHVSSEGFNLGRMLKIESTLDVVSLNADVKGYGLSTKKLNTTINGVVNSIGFNHYTYKNIFINSEIAKGLFNGHFTVKDENIDMAFDGEVNIVKEIPEVNFKSIIKKARLNNLHFIDRDSSCNVKANIDASFVGKGVDNIKGKATISDLKYTEGRNVISTKSIEVLSEINATDRHISLNSEYADLDIKGNFLFEHLFDSFKMLVDKYVSNLNLSKSVYAAKTVNQDFNLTLIVKNATPISQIFVPDIIVANNSKISVSLNSAKNNLTMNVTSDYIKSGETTIQGVKVSINTERQALWIKALARSIKTTDTSGVIDSIFVNVNTDGARTPFTIGVNHTNWAKNKVLINGNITFSGLQQMEIILKEADIVLEGINWDLERNNHLWIDSLRSIRVYNLGINNGDQAIKAEGEYVFAYNPAAAHINNELGIEINNFNLANTNNITKPLGYELEGLVNGRIQVYSNRNISKIGFGADITARMLHINKDSLGIAKVNASWDDESELVGVSASIIRGNAKILDISGQYSLKGANKIDFDVTTDKVYLQLFSRYFNEYISSPRGLVSCNLKITGTASEPSINGKVKFQKTSFIVKYLNTQYSFSDEVLLTEKSIDFNNLTIYDFRGNSSIIGGSIYHNRFKDFQFDISVQAKNFQFLNTNSQQNDMYYGTAYTSGAAYLKGTPDNIILNVAMKTERDTRLFIPLSGGGDVAENDFITFINTGKTDTISKSIRFKKYKHTVDLSGFTLNMALEATTDAEVQLIFDSKIGDIIKASGNGNIKMTINTRGDFNMYGEYIIERGDYLFTLQNVVNKRFLIERGGTIRWNGNPSDAEINLSAVYKLKVPLYDLLLIPDNDAYKRRVPVECRLYMTNKMMNPSIRFDITVPGIDESTATLVRNVLSKENEINNQAMSLLVLGSFSPPAGSNTNTASNTSGGGTYFGSNTSELLSNQFSNLASQFGKSLFSENIDLNVNYKAKDVVTQHEQFDVGGSLQLFDDRVILNGSVGRAYNQNTATMVGDFDLQYKINKDGRLRGKFFNHSVSNSFITYSSPYTQGVGLSYREEFSTFAELWERYGIKKKKK